MDTECTFTLTRASAVTLLEALRDTLRLLPSLDDDPTTPALLELVRSLERGLLEGNPPK
jgi:hypothetical protein